MKKTSLVGLLSVSLLLVSCGGTSYVNEGKQSIPGTNISLNYKETLTLYDNTFTLISLVYGNITAQQFVGACDLEIEKKDNGKLEKTSDENVYKLTAEGGTLRMKFEGDGAYTYKQTMKQSVSTMFKFSDEQWNDILNNKAVPYSYETTSSIYVKVDPINMTFKEL